MEQTPDYRAGLEKALAVLGAEKQKHSVITPAYFVLAKVWDELRREMMTREESK